ncbi:hypothetical protein [Devosia sp.]|uniref:hypothetical protein n=1 Tax=Devosia sp. TaxID=1871048 RepID=UPI00292D48DE|nr:hypothetical protein [Devosia sp.]
MIQGRSIGREIGTALAVLAIYLLTVLAPLHQARASQLAFEELGYRLTQASWVLCSAAGATEGGDVSIAKCPATGIGKAGIVLPTPHALPAAYGAALAAPRLATSPTVLPRIVAPSGGPRAPPVPV